MLSALFPFIHPVWSLSNPCHYPAYFPCLRFPVTFDLIPLHLINWLGPSVHCSAHVCCPSNWVMFGFTIISSQDCNPPPWHMWRCDMTPVISEPHVVTPCDMSVMWCKHRLMYHHPPVKESLTDCAQPCWRMNQVWKAMTRCNNNKTELGTVLCAPALRRVPREQSCHATTETRELK